jgi:hypothetical protein
MKKGHGYLLTVRVPVTVRVRVLSNLSCLSVLL